MAALIGLVAPSVLRANEPRSGVVVVSVTPGLAADKAGLRPGDRILRWQQSPDAYGTLTSPFDALALEIERGPRGPVEMAVASGDTTRSLSLFPDDWGVEVRPDLEPEARAEYESARRSASEGQLPAAVAALTRLSERLRDGAPESEAWALLELARAQLSVDRDGASRTAREARSRAAGPRAKAMVEARFAEALWKQSRLGEAAAAYAEAIRLEGDLDPEGLGLARMLERAGFIAHEQLKGLPEARAGLERALSIVERDAPRSLACARTLHALAQTLDSSVEARRMLQRAAAIAEGLAPESLPLAAILDSQSRVTPEAEPQLELARHALAIRERLAPDSEEVGSSQAMVAVVLTTVGRDDEARALDAQAIALLERVAPEGRSLAVVLGRRGALLKNRGELADAERDLRRALDLDTKASPTSAATAVSLLHLADLLITRREFDGAEQHLRRAVSILEHEAPHSDALGFCLRSLGSVAFERGDLPAAQATLRRSAEVFKGVNPSGFALATVEDRLGRALTAAGRLDEAQAALEHALHLSEGRPTVYVAEIHDDLAAVALQRVDLDAAQLWYEKALSLRQRLAPGSVWEAVSYHALGLLARKRGQPGPALAFFRDAVASLEAQALRLGGSPEVRAAFRAHFHEFYRDLEELLIEGGQEREAFVVVERSRARALLNLLSERDLNFSDAPAELERERRRADAAHDALLARAAAIGAEDPRREDLLRQIADARRRQEEARSQIRSRAPRLASVRDPQPLDLEGVRRVLGPGTLLVAYSLGPSGSRVYALGPGPEDFAVRDLGASEPAIRAEVGRFRALVDERRGSMLRQSLDQESRALGRLLLGPVAGQLAGAKRVLIMPDGILHLLPFSALRDPADAAGRRYLAESAPLHVVSSVSVYAQLTGPPRSTSAGDIVGFGDPAYADTWATGEAAAVTRAIAQGLRLGPLPAARLELEALKTLAPRSTHLWLGAEATEERAKAVGRQTRIVHFATHGFVDEDFPLESGLALSTPIHWSEGRANGLLQAWEVFESVRLDADLVTLSACRTALGKEVSGEGLLGLTWAFQYAGARSVLASLWEVNDASTAELMRRFYGYLRGGVSKAESLRMAQRDLRRRPETSAPFFWAAFELIGDWQ